MPLNDGPNQISYFRNMVAKVAVGVSKWAIITTAEAADAALVRVRRTVAALVCVLALAIAATVAYITLINVAIEACKDLALHPLYRVLVVLIMFVVPSAVLYWQIHRYAVKPIRKPI